ncbi:MAG: aminopeptidase P family protein [Chloroflexi bacterium]|nr:aminopeptidase P family protein [Chloroflexota bacterium]
MTQVSFLPAGLDKNRLVTLMQQRGLHGLLLTSPEHVFYVTGFPALFSSGNPILYGLRNVLPFFALVDANGQITLLCWGGAATDVQYGADIVRTYSDINAAYRTLSEVLQPYAHAGARLGIESSASFAVYTLLRDVLPGDNLLLADELLLQLRALKSPEEVARLERSINVVEKTVSELIDMVHIGIQRPVLMQAAKVGMLKHGASGISHVTISFGASNPEVEIDEPLLPNKLVTLDLGAIVDGYYSDNRRLMYTGAIPAGISALHQTLCGMIDQVAAILAPGVSFGEAYQLAMRLYEQARLKPFIPNIGHTIGMQVEEQWIYEGNSALVFQPRMVLNLEMYALCETGELIGDEETYVITETGYRQLTHLPTAIRAVQR